MSTDSFVSITYMMMDAMAPVTVLSQFFQTENVDIALVKVKLDLCLKDLEQVKRMNSAYLLQLKEDLQGDNFRGHHHITKSNFNLQEITSRFVDGLVKNITSRFPDTDLIQALNVLGMRPISFLSTPELEDYGNTEVEELLKFYGKPQSVQWIDNGETKIKTSQALLDEECARKEWFQLKQVVKAEKYPRDKMWQLWQCVRLYHPEFPNMLKLAQLALTSAVHTAGCERGFSVQNQILSKSRNRLTILKQHELMTIKTTCLSKSELLQEALLRIKNIKHRRIFNIKPRNA